MTRDDDNDTIKVGKQTICLLKAKNKNRWYVSLISERNREREIGRDSKKKKILFIFGKG